MVKDEKLKAVQQLASDLESSPVIGMVDFYKMPSAQLHAIKKELRGKAVIKMIKKTILKFAVEKLVKEGKTEFKKLEEIAPVQPAIILTEMEPFKLYAIVARMKFPAYAKEGDVVEDEIEVSAGPTSLMPGPVISELQSVGIRASIQQGKIAIMKDSVIARPGDVVSDALSGVLRKLNIQPMEIGMNIVAVFESGDIYDKETLQLVLDFPPMLPIAANHAINLSVFIAYPTKENINMLIAKASNEAKALQSLQPQPKSGEAGEKVEEKSEEGGEAKTESAEPAEEKTKEAPAENVEGEKNEAQ